MLRQDHPVTYPPLRSLDVTKRPSPGWNALTPTEQQVVALAADGLTNPQIAERLLMGRATDAGQRWWWRRARSMAAMAAPAMADTRMTSSSDTSPFPTT